MSEEERSHEHMEPVQQPADIEVPAVELGGIALTTDPYAETRIEDVVKAESIARAVDVIDSHDTELQAHIDAFEKPTTPRTEKERYEHFSQAWQDRLAARISVYEAVYDANPDKFANMPTIDFFEFTRKYEYIDKEFNEFQAYFGMGKRTLEAIDRFLEDKKRVDSFTEAYLHGSTSGVRSLLDEIAKNEGIDAHKLKAVVDKYDDIRFNDDAVFDKTPREVLTEERAFVEMVVRHGASALLTKAKEIGRFASENMGEQSPMAVRYAEIVKKLEDSGLVVEELPPLFEQ